MDADGEGPVEEQPAPAAAAAGHAQRLAPSATAAAATAGHACTHDKYTRCGSCGVHKAEPDRAFPEESHKWATHPALMLCFECDTWRMSDPEVCALTPAKFAKRVHKDQLRWVYTTKWRSENIEDQIHKAVSKDARQLRSLSEEHQFLLNAVLDENAHGAFWVDYDETCDVAELEDELPALV